MPQPPTEHVEPGRDLAIIACQRRTDEKSREKRIFGVRWASRPDIGYPLIGYFVERIVDGGSPEPIGSVGGVFLLPRTDTWSQFEAEIAARRPLAGPYFPAADIIEDNFGYLMPLIRLIGPNTASNEFVALTMDVGDFFGNMHKEDAQLTIDFWPGGSPPTLADLLAAPVTRARLIAYYIGRSTGYLLALALRFEYAVLLGLATDDVDSEGSEVVYRVSTRWKSFGGEATTDPVPTNRFCAPRAPLPFHVSRAPGSVAHPAFRDFAGWNPSTEILAIDSNGTPQTPESLIPRPPAFISALEWGAPEMSGQLIDHVPVLYDLQRFAHGANTAGMLTPPAPPAPDDYEPVLAGELLMRPTAPPHAFDRYGMDWPPLAGYYHYQLRGIDLLGVAGPPTEAVVRHHDDLAPPAPGLRLRNEAAISYAGPQSMANLDLEVVWHAPHDFIGPDAVEFRLATRWLPRRVSPVQVLAVTPDPDSVLYGLATLDHLPEPVNWLAGLRMILLDGEYPIVGHAAGQSNRIRIRRVGGRLPAPDQDGVILGPGDEIAATRIARISRRPAVSALATNVQSVNPLRFELHPAGAGAVPQQEDFPIYLHLLRTTFYAVSEGGSSWRIDAPDATDVRSEAWNDWLSLSDPAGLLSGSPTIAFPQHPVTITIGPPAGFEAGLVMIDVTAADDAAYVPSPALPAANASLAGLTGNESTPATAILSVRVLTPPPASEVAGYDPARYMWAESAAVFAEDALYTVGWAAVAGTAHYEVWRALEGALTGTTPTTDDLALRALGLAQPDAFAMRIERVFAPRYRDRLPGRAPTRALYRVRAVSLAGVPGAWSGLIGPVHVPDVRQPPAPNFSRLVVPLPTGGDPAAAERRLLLEWTQAGPMDDIRFDIELKDREGDVWSTVASKPRGTAPDPGPQRLYRHEVGDLIPGELRELRVRAVREARDPIDPLGQIRREIVGPPSSSRAGRATGGLPAPAALAAKPSTASAAHLRWTNQDRYRGIEILRQGPDEHHRRRIATIAGDSNEFFDLNVATGSWLYTLRALGHSRQAESETAEVDLP